MNSDKKYDLIYNSLLNGKEEDWERLALQFPNFYNERDSDEAYEDNDGKIHQLGRFWITNAIDCGSLESVRWIISKGANLRFVDGEGYSPLHSCIDREFSDKYEIMQLLIDNGADVNIGAELGTMALNSWSPLHMAAARNDLQAIKILLDNGADTTLKTIIDNYCTAEQEAENMGNREVAEFIRTYKAK